MICVRTWLSNKFSFWDSKDVVGSWNRWGILIKIAKNFYTLKIVYFVFGFVDISPHFGWHEPLSRFKRVPWQGSNEGARKYMAILRWFRKNKYMFRLQIPNMSKQELGIPVFLGNLTFSRFIIFGRLADRRTGRPSAPSAGPPRPLPRTGTKSNAILSEIVLEIGIIVNEGNWNFP